MAASVNLDRQMLTGNFVADYKDEIPLRYRCDFDGVQYDDPEAALAAAQALGLPVRRQRYTPFSHLYCNSIRMSVSAERLDYWFADVVFSTPPEGEDDEQQNENPLLRPPVFNIEYIEQEYVIEKARNVEGLLHGNGAGGNRAADTLGPIVNAAGTRPDEPIVDTERNAVLVIQRNFASLAEIIDLNETYQKTTNDADVALGSGTVGARRLKYLMTSSLGKQIENGIEFWPGVTQIEVKKTTDLIIDNVGYDRWDGTAVTPFLTAAGERPGEPRNLNMDGGSGGDFSHTITYRHLEEVDYSPLLS
jgi:hypothetical protein